MKILKHTLIIAVGLLFVMACKNETQPEIETVSVISDETAVVSAANEDANYAKVMFNIDGMTCAMGCAKTIEKKMAKMDGVKSAKVDFENELAMVEFDEAKVTPESLEEVVTKVAGGGVYIVKNMAKVESFEAKKPCPEDCNKACCTNKSEEEKMACAKDCDKPCCQKKA